MARIDDYLFVERALGDDPRRAERDEHARRVLGEIYGIPPSPDGSLPDFNLSNVDLGRVFTREEAQPDTSEYSG